MTAMPSLFLSHGAPTLALSDSPARHFLAGLGAEIGRPRAVVVATAHWEAAAPAVGGAAAPETVHDFHGFPPELYAVRYPAPGAPDLAAAVAARLAAAGLPAAVDPRRGLDHGVWVPLSLMYPAADVPVVPLSVQSGLGAEHHLRLGAALAGLRDEGVLVVGSGSLTHNLREFRGRAEDAPPPDWVAGFADWVAAAVAGDRRDDLAAWERLAPGAARNHPTPEHLLPLFVALGAGRGPGRRLHASHSFGILAMDVYAWA
ncbi:MAG TPA: class III extradiol ring-cleavage dioxygenase [Alphaproteobacteria bacterium]|nr:class III extradiol ring-cleavage dioxygenase [Alphaproteobacteria bacterium]